MKKQPDIRHLVYDVTWVLKLIISFYILRNLHRLHAIFLSPAKIIYVTCLFFHKSNIKAIKKHSLFKTNLSHCIFTEYKNIPSKIFLDFLSSMKEKFITQNFLLKSKPF